MKKLFQNGLLTLVALIFSILFSDIHIIRSDYVTSRYS
jgi:hypothetical protein